MFSKYDTVSYKGKTTEVVAVDASAREALVMILNPTNKDKSLVVLASELTLIAKY